MESPKPKFLIELLIVVIIGFVVSLVLELFAAITIIILFYLFSDGIFRKRSWQSFGFKRKTIWTDFKANWYLIVLVTLVGPLLMVIGSRIWFPLLIYRLFTRIASFATQLGFFPTPLIFFGMMAIVTFIIELVYRGFFQNRLSWYFNGYVAVIIAAILFGVSHIGLPLDFLPVLAMDIVLVIIDGIIFGLIFFRSQNLLLTWITHLIGNQVAILLLIFL